jgi:integrase
MIDALPVKPAKPRPDFPLTAHASGKWCKKIRGRIYYFGRWDDPDAAERDYDRLKHALREGRTPMDVEPDTLIVRQFFVNFLSRQLERVKAGSMTERSYVDQRKALADFARAVNPTRLVADLRPIDFANARTAWGKRLGPYAIGRYISHVKSAFRWGERNGYITLPIAMGDGFNKPSISERRRSQRQKAQEHGEKLFTPAECRRLVNAADAPLKAMILLGLNCGFLATDVANLPKGVIDFEDAYIEFPRTKTEVMRACVIWPETAKALKEAIAIRPKARLGVDDDMVFLTKYGNRWVHDRVHHGNEGITKVSHVDAIGQEFKRLQMRIGLKRKHRGFSALRTTFRTVADEVGDRNAVMLTMGHAFPGMDEWYVRKIVRPRLQKVNVHVRRKLLNAK